MQNNTLLNGQLQHNLAPYTTRNAWKHRLYICPYTLFAAFLYMIYTRCIELRRQLIIMYVRSYSADLEAYNICHMHMILLSILYIDSIFNIISVCKRISIHK